METTLNTNVPVVPVKNQGRVQVPGPKAQTEVAISLPTSSGVELEIQLQQAQAKREQAVRQAANTFIISDQRFTIYKDLSGQFITRFTSLRDGRVTYIPEPDVLSWLNQSSKGTSPSLSLEV